MLATASALSLETKVTCADAGVNPGDVDSATLHGNPVATTTFLDRLLTVYYAACQREKVPRINYTDIARRVEGHSGIPVVQTTVTRWFTGSRPERELMVGLCKALGEGLLGGIDPGWLDYGDDSKAPAPSFTANERRFLPAITPAEADEGRSRKAHASAKRKRPNRG